MHEENGEVHIEDTEASGGRKTGHVRWILIIGTLLAIVGLSAIWMTGAATQTDAESEITATGKIDAKQDGTDTDGITSDRMVSDDENTPETAAEQDGIATVEN